jgi:hypothetical protein
VNVSGKSEWWRIIISWEKNVDREIIFWDGGSKNLRKIY